MYEYSPSAPKPLTFDFELPPSAGSSSPSDPFNPPRTRPRSVRSRASGRVQSHSQNDVLTIPATDVSNFLDMLGRASARVDENSRKRMKARESELKMGRSRARVQRTLVKGKERVRSMDELGHHEKSVTDTHDAGGHYSSLPIMPSKDPLSQEAATTHTDPDDVHMHAGVGTFTTTGDDDTRLPHSSLSYPINGTEQHVPPRCPATTRSSQKRGAPPSPTPIRFVPATLRPMSTPAQKLAPAPPKQTPIPPSPPPPSAHHASTSTGTQILIPAPTPLPQPLPAPLPPATSLPSQSALPTTPASKSLLRRCTSTTSTSSSSTHFPPSQTYGPKRALGMTGRCTSSSDTLHSAAAKKPFRPPLVVRPSPTASAPRPVNAATVTVTVTAAPAPAPAPAPAAAAAAAAALPGSRVTRGSTTSRESKRVQTPQQKEEDEKCFGTDPDSSFDMSFDFDPEALEAAMRKYD
jgi:hypothetical protein